MAEIRSFRAIRYNTSSGADLSSVVAPPYDVINQQQYKDLLSRSRRNIVRMDLPHMPAKSLGPPEAYTGAGKLLKEWLDGGVMIQEEKPAMYYCRQSFPLQGRTVTRCGFLARVRAEGQSGSIAPHEQTFSGPKEDRLALTKATSCNLSPIFGLYPDANNGVLEALRPQRSQCDFSAELGGVRNELWVVSQDNKIKRASQLMRQKKIYIADGHHRYLTSLAYREHLEEAGQKLNDQHPANFTSMILVSTADPGLVILPTHRVARNLPGDFVERLRAETAGRIQWTDTGLGADRAGEFSSLVAQKQRPVLGLYSPGEDRLHLLIPGEADLLLDYEPERSSVWRSLSVSILHRYLLEEILGKRITPGRTPEVAYLKDGGRAVADCRAGNYQAAFITQAPTMAQLSAVVEAGELMPQKSTFFYPKIPSGLIINPLY